jgi:N-acetylglucosamine transport system permease protein
MTKRNTRVHLTSKRELTASGHRLALSRASLAEIALILVATPPVRDVSRGRAVPVNVYEAAIVDGAGEWRAFFQVMLPMAGPGMASVAILNFLGLWNQFLLPLVLNNQYKENTVLSQGLNSFAARAGYEVDFGALFAAAVITIAPVLVVYIIFQRRLQGSVSQGTFR